MPPGVRCAETTPTSNGTSNSASACAAACMTDQSLSLPMITPTSGAGTSAMFVPSVCPLAVRQPVCRPGGAFADSCDVLVVVPRAPNRAEDIHVPDFASRSFRLAVEVHLGIGHSGEQVV